MVAGPPPAVGICGVVHVPGKARLVVQVSGRIVSDARGAVVGHGSGIRDNLMEGLGESVDRVRDYTGPVLEACSKWSDLADRYESEGVWDPAGLARAYDVMLRAYNQGKDPRRVSDTMGNLVLDLLMLDAHGYGSLTGPAQARLAFLDDECRAMFYNEPTPAWDAEAARRTTDAVRQAGRLPEPDGRLVLLVGQYERAGVRILNAKRDVIGVIVNRPGGAARRMARAAVNEEQTGWSMERILMGLEYEDQPRCKQPTWYRRMRRGWAPRPVCRSTVNAATAQLWGRLPGADHEENGYAVGNITREATSGSRPWSRARLAIIEAQAEQIVSRHRYPTDHAGENGRNEAIDASTTLTSSIPDPYTTAGLIIRIAAVNQSRMTNEPAEIIIEDYHDGPDPASIIREAARPC